jgi:hypothetical protein
MYKKLILAGAMTAAFAAPAFAEWNVLKPNQPPATATQVCMVVERAAAPGETQIAGPFASEEEAKTAAMSETCMGADTGSAVNDGGAAGGSDSNGGGSDGNAGGNDSSGGGTGSGSGSSN